MRLVALGFGMLTVNWSRLKTFQAQLNASASDANIGVMILEYVLKKEHVVIEDDVHAILDLKKAGEIECWAIPEYDLVAWNKEEGCVFGLLKKSGKNYKLSLLWLIMTSMNLSWIRPSRSATNVLKLC